MMRGGPGSLRPPTLSTKDAYHVFVPCVGETCGRGGTEDEEESRKRCCQEEKEGGEIEEQAAKAARQIKKSLRSAVFIG